MDEAITADQLWSTVEDHVTKSFATFRDGFDSKERDFFVAMIPWVKAVKRTTSLLVQRQDALLWKLQEQPLSIVEYQRIEKEYQLSVENYLRLGATLQPLMEKLLK